MRWDWAAAAQTKSTAETSGRGVAVAGGRGEGSSVEQCGVGGWAQHQGTDSGTSSVFLRTGRPWPDRMGEWGGWGKGGSGAANMLEKRGERESADGG